MKLFTATGQTQGQRPNDFHYCVEGELVGPPALICDRDADDPDGGCGCGRAWIGLSSHQATTTAVIRDLDGINTSDYIELVTSTFTDQGWDIDDATEIAEELARIAADHPVGTVFGNRLGEPYVRDSDQP